MPKLTEEQQDGLRSLRLRLQKDLDDAELIAMSLIFNISFGEDFYEDVELNIKKALDGIGDLLGDDFDA